MPADEVEPTDTPLIGFHSYADDTPRDDVEAGFALVPAPVEPGHDLIEEAAPLRLEMRPAERARSHAGLWAAVIAVGVVAASAAAIGFSVQRSERVSDQLALDAANAPIQITHAAPEPPVLAMATVDPQPIPTKPAVSAPPAPRPTARPEALTPSTLPAELRPDAPAPARVAPARDPAEFRLGPAVAGATPRRPVNQACANARSRAELMVCSDPGLTAEDRQMVRAYNAALAAGAPPRRLAQEQQDWLLAREQASRRSRQAVENLYARRIGDLAEWLDDGGDEAARQLER